MYIDFIIRSEKIDLSVLNKIIKIDPAYIDSMRLLKKGDKIRTGYIMEYDEWSFYTKKCTVVFIDELLSAFRQSLGDNFFKLSSFIQDNRLKSYLCVVIEGAEPDNFPALSIPQDNIKFLYELNADLDFDIYFE